MQQQNLIVKCMKTLFKMQINTPKSIIFLSINNLTMEIPIYQQPRYCWQIVLYKHVAHILETHGSCGNPNKNLWHQQRTSNYNIYQKRKPERGNPTSRMLVKMRMESQMNKEARARLSIVPQGRGLTRDEYFQETKKQRRFSYTNDIKIN